MAAELHFEDRAVAFDDSLLIELTKRCNYECAHCYTNASPSARGPEPTPRQVHALAAAAHRSGFSSIILSGGELMLRHDVDEIVEGIDEGIDLWLFTSGIHLDFERLLRWKQRVAGYAVSLDGGRSPHNRLRRSAKSFDDILAFLKRLAALELRIQIQSMTQRGELDDLESRIELAEAVCTERILFSHMSPDGRGQNLLDAQMNERELDELFLRVRALQQKTPVKLRTNLMPCEIVSSRFPKPAIHVLPTGEVLPWFGVPARFSLGNLTGHGWDLEALAGDQVFPPHVEAGFRMAKEQAEEYKGRAVPVDDLLVLQFRGAPVCV